MPQFEPVEIKCGKLVTNAAPEDVGIKDYIIKRDFRRITMDRDARREGYVPFQPNQGHATTPTRLPSTTGESSIVKITQVKGANGLTYVIAANPDSIFAYTSLTVQNYFAGDQTPQAYFDDTIEAAYFQEVFNDWVLIGGQFSGFATYWEAVQVNNILVMNNGVDLPVWFNVQNQTVTPMYELRDQGIASVGTIWEYNGILMLGDVVEISDTVEPGQTQSPFDQLMASTNPYVRFSVTDTLQLVGLPMFGSMTEEQITQYLPSITNTFQYRVLWSMPGQPSRYAASVPCATTFGSNTITLQWKSKSFSNGQQVLILGAGVNGGNITATILWINPANGAEMFLDTTMLATLPETLIQSLDSVGSLVGFEDLDDDGSAVIRGEKIMTSCVIYKDTSIFVCNYTGVTTAPFAFRCVYSADNIFYRNTLVSVVHNWQSWHFFAGKNALYRFDLIGLTPTPVFKEVQNLFFANAANLKTWAPFVFAVNNSITKEIWLNNPFYQNPVDGGSDVVLCLDYFYDTISTCGMKISSGAVVQFPTSAPVAQSNDVFLMGDLSLVNSVGGIGTVIQYGLSNNGLTGVFSKTGINCSDIGYPSVLRSGLGAAGSRINDTIVNGYELRVSKLTGGVTMSLVGENNPNQLQTFWTVTRTAAGGAIPSLFIPCSAVAQVFGDIIQVSDPDVQCEVVARSLLAMEIETHGAGRS